MSDDKIPPALWHQSGVNREGEPFIQLILGDKVIAQQSCQQAREHALAMLEAAEAAEQDAFLVHWAKSALGVDEKVAAAILQDFRRYRLEETGKRSGDGSDPGQIQEIWGKAMTPEQLIANISFFGRQDLCVILQYLADHVQEARLYDGGTELNDQRRLADCIDFKIWLEELAKAAQERMLRRMPVRSEQPRWGSWKR